jgi:Flp pilus assembly protein TadB
LIRTLVITIVIESLVALGYCRWRRKPLSPILLTSFFANIATQSLLWTVVNIFYQHYLVTLLIAELVIWLLESIALYYVRRNQLSFPEAASLSLSMNVASFAAGWFMPV